MNKKARGRVTSDEVSKDASDILRVAKIQIERNFESLNYINGIMMQLDLIRQDLTKSNELLEKAKSVAGSAMSQSEGDDNT